MRQSESVDAAGPPDAAHGAAGDAIGHVFRAPGLSLPAGGGAIRGIGEKFTCNPVLGTAAASIPIATSPGRAGFGPNLTLTYNSGSGNGVFGLGWSLALPAIARKTDKGLPLYLDEIQSDVFLLSSSEDLVPVLQPDGRRFETTADGYVIHRYRPRIEGTFARIERWTGADGDVHWRSLSQDNVLTLYGKDRGSRLYDPADESRVFSWLISESRDDKGNAIVYAYKAEDGGDVDRRSPQERNRWNDDGSPRVGNRHLKSIRYGNRKPLVDGEGRRPPFIATAILAAADWMFEVVFDYGEHDAVAPGPSDAGDWLRRNDPFSTFRAGFDVRTYRLCQRVLMFHHFPGEPDIGIDGLVRSTDFAYRGEPAASFLASATQSGYKRTGDGYLRKSLPAVEFDYSLPVVGQEVRGLDTVTLGDMADAAGEHSRWVDLDGEGLAGLLTDHPGGWIYRRNQSPLARETGDDNAARFAAAEQIKAMPNAPSLRDWQFLDLAGDGSVDLVDMRSPAAGFFERSEDGGWAAFQAFRSTPKVDWNDPGLRFVDLTGDGLPDIVLTENEALTWHPSLAEDGFGPSTRASLPVDGGPGGLRTLQSDTMQTVALADMSGDGLSDIVRIRNGDVCYWPNLGYGRFGAKVTMADAPRFDLSGQFDPRRIERADIDGSGVADILYLGADGARFWFNLSGNGWGAENAIPGFPVDDRASSVSVTDLLGNGTACLVWVSPLPDAAERPLRYVSLMANGKPHLLVAMRNNLGAETRIAYAPSTYFYLRDKQDGRPWLTRLPFPVQVVERVETWDHISRNRFVTRYAYHHGYFDGVEREFRGFGMVEQWDTEAFSLLSAAGTLDPAENIDAASHVPPAYTRTWFHTGIFLGRNRISSFFAGLLDPVHKGEYFRQPGLDDAAARAFLLDDTVLPDGLDVDEEREACRALRGSMLRQETYALDGTARADIPYLIVEQNFTVSFVQPRVANRHAVFFVHPREALSYASERDPADPRLTHRLTLQVDAYGTVLKNATITYPRRQPDAALDPSDEAVQAQIAIVATDNAVTNAVDEERNHRKPAVFDTRAYEITGLGPKPGSMRILFEDMWQALTDAQPLAFEEKPNAATLQKRLLSRKRSLFRRDDLEAALAPGLLQPLALPFSEHRLALTPGLASGVYGAKISDPILAQYGYVRIDGDDGWWAPSGRIFYSKDRSDSAAAERAIARAHFFLPRRFHGPLDTDAVPSQITVTFDEHDLLVIETKDAVGNLITAGSRNPDDSLASHGNDYRVLQPRLVMDANRNRSAVVFNALGLIAGTAVMGKPPPAQAEGDTLDGFDTDPPEDQCLEHIAAPLAAPQAMLLRATVRTVYDFFAYQRTRTSQAPQPAVSCTLSRETHDSDAPAGATRFQHALTYSDGFGREIQKKVLAEPGPVPLHDAAGAIVTGPDGQTVMTAEPVDPRWIGSGWAFYNNKGMPIRQYEPFFTPSGTFEFGTRIGVSSTRFYDPLGRVVGALHPDHTWEKTVFGAWRQEKWDTADTCLVDDPSADPDCGAYFERLHQVDYLPTWRGRRADGSLGPDEAKAAAKSAIHAGTPEVVHLNPLGRIFLTNVRNRFTMSDAPAGSPPVETVAATRIARDITGNLLGVTDAAGRVVARYDHDMLGTRIHQASMEAGQDWMLSDATGAQVLSWNSRGFRVRIATDPAGRPIGTFVSQNDAAEMLVAAQLYGEALADGQTGNRRGKLVEQRDQVGLLRNEGYDFKGNLLSAARQLATDYKNTMDWSGAVALDPAAHRVATVYDALNRVVASTMPDGSILRPGYNEGGLLERVDANLRGAVAEGSPVWTPFVINIDYDAKAQRQRIDYGNGVATLYVYDPLTFRLLHLQTIRSAAAFPQDCPVAAQPGWPGCDVQNLHYVYDAVGNITHIRDDAQQTVYFRNKRVEPSSDYTYDALYRLIEATGREHLGQVGGSPIPSSYNDMARVGLPHPGDGAALGRYLERYVYDKVGNFLEMQHRGTDPLAPGWTRTYVYEEASLLEPGKTSNRLTRTSLGAGSDETYSVGSDGYDAHGNMLRMPHLAEMRWDYAEQLRMTRRQSLGPQDIPGSAAAGQRTWYVYDGAGKRARKVTENANGSVKEERLYLGGFEIYRSFGANALTRETLHIEDGTRRIALVETRTDRPHPKGLVRYQLANHLGTASLELDATAIVISYEEYTPFGSSSYQAVDGQLASPKRYRFIGKERDEESGLYYHGARYYSPWLGRWTSCDPAGLKGGIDLFVYALCNPVVLLDPTGNEPQRCSVCLPPGTIKVETEMRIVKTGKLTKTTEYIFPTEEPKKDDWSAPYQFHYGDPPPEDPAKVAAEEKASREALVESYRLAAQALATRTVERYEAIKGGGALIGAGAVGIYLLPELMALIPAKGWFALSLFQLAQAEDENDPNFVFGVLGVAAGTSSLASELEAAGPKATPKRSTSTAKSRVTSAEVEEALKEAAEEASKTTLYHFGDIEGGLTPGRNFSTTPDSEYAEEFIRMHGGKVNKFQVPTSRLKELKDAGSIEYLNDSIRGTGISGPEIRFKGTRMDETLAKEMNSYRVE
ncbi:SpvB/TcaC N-terminal domain-containing protein [Mesorhizobium sp. M0571]|uniref:SpvB/TcaC N-terminal domain-containing protein n=1 Tax=Mesorhizobium sp. M0571 TaxID=2956960 RepID=UPI00333D338A